MNDSDQPNPARRSPEELLEARNRQISAVHTISRELSATLDLDERLKQILTVSMEAVGALAGSILLYRANDDKLVFQHVVGPNSANLIGFEMDAGKGIAGSVFNSGQGQIENDPEMREIHQGKVSVERAGFVTENMVTIPLKYQEGRPVGVMQVLNKRGRDFDESDLEVLEILASIAATAIENAQLHREAQLAATARTVGDLSHEIKNKVSPIFMVVHPMRGLMDDLYAGIDSVRGALPDEKRDLLSKSSDFLRSHYNEWFDITLYQIQEIQDYTKLIADAFKGVISEPELVPNELVPLVEKQLDVLEPLAGRESVRIVRELSEVPPFRFDQFLLKCAVYNLVHNAIPETPSGGRITVRTEAVDSGRFPVGGYAMIEVRDTGRGMPPQVMERILRGDAKSTKPGGSGLGTRIVYNAVAAHKGVLEGESVEGAGTSFRVKLPYRREALSLKR